MLRPKLGRRRQASAIRPLPGKGMPGNDLLLFHVKHVVTFTCAPLKGNDLIRRQSPLGKITNRCDANALNQFAAHHSAGICTGST